MRAAKPAAAESPARAAMREAATMLLGHFVPDARAILAARAPEAGAKALAAIDAGAGAMDVRQILLVEIARG